MIVYRHLFNRFRIYVPVKNLWTTKARWVVYESEANRAVNKAYKQGRADAIAEVRNAEASKRGG